MALVFLGAGSIISLNKLAPGGGEFLIGVALAHGLAIAVMVIAVGHISGGHFNPAVTAAALFARKIRLELGALYILFQLLGAVAGSFLLVAALPSDWWEPVHLGTPAVRDGFDPAKAVLVEAVLTFFLVFVIFGSAIDKRNPASPVAGLAIGLTITADILMGGPLTGAAMNPARAFGPALLSRTWDLQHVYWAGPILGGIIAGLVYDTAYFESRPKAPTPSVESPPEPTPPAPPPPQ